SFLTKQLAMPPERENLSNELQDADAPSSAWKPNSGSGCESLLRLSASLALSLFLPRILPALARPSCWTARRTVHQVHVSVPRSNHSIDPRADKTVPQVLCDRPICSRRLVCPARTADCLGFGPDHAARTGSERTRACRFIRAHFGRQVKL